LALRLLNPAWRHIPSRSLEPPRIPAHRTAPATTSRPTNQASITPPPAPPDEDEPVESALTVSVAAALVALPEAFVTVTV